MRISLCSLILVILCATLHTSCSQKPKIKTETVVNVQPLNYTLASTEVEENFPVVNVYSRKQPPRSINKILEKFAPAKQSFDIDPTITSTVTCKNGTKLKFDPCVFVYSDTKLPVKEKVNITVTEYLSDADILFKGLATTSNKELIETAGMIYIEAKADGMDCEISDGEYYSIEIPSEEEKENMELFYGVETAEGVNWESAGKGNYKGNFMGNDRIDDYNYMDLIWKKKTPTQFMGGIGPMYDYLNNIYEFPEDFNNDHLKAVAHIYFTVDFNGKVSKAYTPEEHRTYADSQLIAAFQNSPAWDISLTEGNYNKKMMVPVKMNWVHDPTLIPAKLIADTRTAPERFSAFYEGNSYLMVSSKLGWINCDRFRDPAQAKTDLFVVLDSTYEATVKIVFNDIRSFLCGARYTGGFNFSNVPIGESITIVAIRLNNDVTELAMKTCTVYGDPIDDLEFKPVDKADMVREFDKLAKAPDEEVALN
ncbi:MAG: hypothetical protein ACHQFW_06265 [Chitinophagales bacterium]